VNSKNAEGGNDTVCAGRDLPWLQDTEEQDVWISWGISYRDVVVVDEQNKPLSVFNLTDHNLGLPAQYDSLKAILREAADGP
jgi:hypothetical protein